jgi:hypothetical protein
MIEFGDRPIIDASDRRRGPVGRRTKARDA